MGRRHRSPKHRDQRPSPAKSFLRIIGGKWRGRKITFTEAEGLRPTSDRVRETVFNWLAPYIPGASVLDLFAGSGVLGFEALSRGASNVTLVETSGNVCKNISANIKLLETKNCQVFHENAEHWLLNNLEQEKFDVVFLDPPFNDGLLPNTLKILDESDCLAPGGFVYVECGETLEEACSPSSWTIHRHKKTGAVFYYLFRRD